MAARDYSWEILKAVRESDIPVGAIHLSGKLGIPPANIGRTLIRLEERGLVEKVQNKGRSITKQGRQYLEEEELKNQKITIANELIDFASLENKKNLLEILQVRKLLEGYTARRCAEMATPELIQELENIQFDYIYELRHARTGSEQDLALHLKIAEGSGNHAIARILKLLLTDNDSYAEFTKAALRLKGLSQGEHCLILEAIREKDGERAASEMEAHLNRVVENVERYFDAGDKA